VRLSSRLASCLPERSILLKFASSFRAGPLPVRSISSAEAYIPWPRRIKKINPHPFLIANRIQHASYVSLQSALAYYGLIPERVPMTTSVTTGRPLLQKTPLGEYQFRHIQTDWFQAYLKIDLGLGQTAFVATPEKALLDLIYLEPNSETPAFCLN